MDVQQTQRSKSEVLWMCQSYVLQTLVVIALVFYLELPKAWLGWPRAIVWRTRQLTFRINTRTGGWGVGCGWDVTQGGARTLSGLAEGGKGQTSTLVIRLQGQQSRNLKNNFWKSSWHVSCAPQAVCSSGALHTLWRGSHSAWYESNRAPELAMMGVGSKWLSPRPLYKTYTFCNGIGYAMVNTHIPRRWGALEC